MGLIGLITIWVYNEIPITLYDDLKQQKFEVGESIYTTYCSACHGLKGEGLEPNFPPIVLSKFAPKYADFEELILKGLNGEIIVNGREYSGAMPAFQLDNEELKSLYEYIQSWD